MFFTPPPTSKIDPDWLDDCPGEIRCMFDEDGNYTGGPSLWPSFLEVGVIALIVMPIILMFC